VRLHGQPGSGAHGRYGNARGGTDEPTEDYPRGREGAAAREYAPQARRESEGQGRSPSPARRRRPRYFARWPASVYPGQTDPTRGLQFTADECPEKPNDLGVYVMGEKSHRYPHVEPSDLRDEWQTSWRRLHERWQRVRARLMRMCTRNATDKVMVYTFSPHYRDMRRWELRRVARVSAWDENDPKLWEWWSSLPFKSRFRIISDSWLKGIRVNRLWIFQNTPKPKEIAA
jgi:hypothetical protein